MKVQLESLEDKKSELQSELDRVRSEGTSCAVENVKLKRNHGTLMTENERLIASNTKLVDQLRDLYDEMQSWPASPRADWNPLGYVTWNVCTVLVLLVAW